MSGVGKWTDERLSGWICEFMEPVQSLLSTGPTHSSELLRLGYTADGVHWYSPLKCWWEGNGYTWQHRDMIHDARMTVMLLEKLVRREGASIVLSRWLNLADTFVVCDCDVEDGVTIKTLTYVAAPTLGRAICEGFAIANGAGGMTE